jgi:hypothetical protein
MKSLKNKIILSLLIGLISTSAMASDNYFRIGAKFGFPNLVSINAEYVLPVLDHRIAPIVDFSDFTITIENVKADFSYWEYGMNIYFTPNGKGLYANGSYINMKSNLEYTGLSSKNLPSQLENGTATTDVKIKSFAIKLGGKFGGKFYVRPEIGYVFSSLDKNITIEASFNHGKHVETQTEKIPSILTSGLIANIGFGFAF